jgi:hypothetical protein
MVLRTHTQIDRLWAVFWRLLHSVVATPIGGSCTPFAAEFPLRIVTCRPPAGIAARPLAACWAGSPPMPTEAACRKRPITVSIS